MKRRSPQERRAMEQEALSRAQNFSTFNFGTVIEEFAGRGIDPADIRPKENVFSYHAWRALGRQVRKGEHGVKITTFVPMVSKDADALNEGEQRSKVFTRPATAVVFHVSQTDPVAELVNA